MKGLLPLLGTVVIFECAINAMGQGQTNMELEEAGSQNNAPKNIITTQDAINRAFCELCSNDMLTDAEAMLKLQEGQRPNHEGTYRALEIASRSGSKVVQWLLKLPKVKDLINMESTML